MGDRPPRSDRDPVIDDAESGEQLRALSFRMREIQRLLAMRVEQENRRLEAEGLDRVKDTTFREDPTAD